MSPEPQTSQAAFGDSWISVENLPGQSVPLRGMHKEVLGMHVEEYHRELSHDLTRSCRRKASYEVSERPRAVDLLQRLQKAIR